MGSRQFRLMTPRTLAEAISNYDELNGDAHYLAGGTDLLVNMREQLTGSDNLISLALIDELKEMSRFTIGAGVTLADLIRGAQQLPEVIGRTARLIAGPAIRESATVGGNILLTGRCLHYNCSALNRLSAGACMKAEGDLCIAVPQKSKCYAPFSGDLAPVLLALGAKVRVFGKEGEREIGLDRLYSGNGLTTSTIAPGEILTKVTLPGDALEVRAAYQKLRPRSAMDFPDAGVAVAVTKDRRRVRAALGALSSAPSVFIAESPSPVVKEDWKSLSDYIWSGLAPSIAAVRNTTYSPSYRREMARLFLDNLIVEALS